ncbi:hypothetical protein HZU77_013275 [Neisseriaceae bacterium TC5R-5]|nr:hypothetical protein [Neisseriaceae bacterium TC5R-5]
MANLTEKPVWEQGIYQLETSDPVLGGPDGIDNLQGKQLANRTAYLKKQLDDAVSGELTLDNAAKWKTARAITISGDAGLSFKLDGSADISAQLTLANTTVKAGSYSVITVDSKGRATAGRALEANDFPALDWSKITTGKPTTLAGYGITDAATKADLTAKADKAATLAGYGISDGLTRLKTGQVLPTSDIGPIWHDDYNSVLTWQVFDANGATYKGYASVLIGSVLLDTQPTPRAGYIRSRTGNLSKNTYPALFAWAQHNGLMVAPGAWQAGAVVCADNGDGTFRIFDVRGEFFRAWDDSRGVDVGRGFGSAQLDAFQGHNRDLIRASGVQDHLHGITSAQSGGGQVTPCVVGSGDNWITRSYLTQGSYGTPRVAAETRPRNLALAAYIKI